MEPIKIVCWKWKDPKWPHAYTAEHVNVFADSITRNLSLPHQIFCITDDPEGINQDIGIIKLWPDFKDMSWCFPRLRAFSEEMKNLIGDGFFSIDLDTVICGSLDALLTSAMDGNDFVIAKDTQPGNCYNGSFWGMKSGARKKVFEEFAADPKGHISACKALGYHPDDQSVMAVILGANEKTLGPADGLYSYKNDIVKNHAGKLPANAKMVFFHGNPKPWDFPSPKIGKPLPWITENWRRNKRGLLILGGGSCVWDDLKKIDVNQFDVMTVNDMGYCYKDRIDYWVTLHPENLPAWRSKRTGNKSFEAWSHTKLPVANLNGVLEGYWKASTGLSGSSSMFAAQVGIHLGYDYILLAGCPMDAEHNQTGPKESWNQKISDNFWTAWIENADKMKGKVFSLSGRTKELLGFKEFKL